MKKLKICLISLTVAPDSQDGSAKFIRGVFDYLNKQNHINVKLITAKWNKKLINPNIIQIKVIKKSFLWIPQFVFNVLKYIKGQHFDIIHGNGPKGSLPLTLLSKKRKFISTLHDLGPFETKFSIIPIEKYLFKQVAKKATFITTCSNSIRKELKDHIKELDMHQIYNLYSAIEDKFRPYPKEAQELKEKLKIDGPVILYIGRIALYKGVNDIISAYKHAKQKIPNLTLLLGGKPDFYMEKIFQEWKRKFKDIYFLGFIPEEEIAIYYSMADVFITYSYAAEGFGLTPFEAIACGTPVICSSLPAFKEILQDNALFVPPRSPSLLAKEIINLINDEEKRSMMIKKAQQFIKRYSWDSVGKKLEQIYEMLLNYKK
ncbi:MAG: glycosyltransferase family 4 protein [Promethearchaeota archaeon]